MNDLSAITAHETYFEMACHFFRRSGFTSSPGSYLIHNKNRRFVKVGIGEGRRVSLPLAAQWPFDLIAKDGQDVALFDVVRASVDSEAPCFFLVSPDFKRAFCDVRLPFAVFVQPQLEFRFSVEKPHGEISYTLDVSGMREAQQMLSELVDNIVPLSTATPLTPLLFAKASADWKRVESDAAFLERLEVGILALQDHPNGKMTMMRSFFRAIPKEIDRFDIFQQHARNNGEYACSHFFCIDETTFSFGCSPENTFEIIGGDLHVDIVASTCKAGQGEAFERRELIDNPKQQKEHLATIESRSARYEPFCDAQRMRLIMPMQIKRLRNVCHLHSLVVGTLRPQITFFDIAPTLFPIMGANPTDLLPLSDSDRSPHRFYGGIIGHWEKGYTGSFLNLRNALVQGDTIHAKVGMGVLRESDAASELAETEDKISGLMEAVFQCCQA
ncbi:chorismate-binding protein [Parasedimentitalea marina]|uniref:chorismate-binding protein n=1 Tax=Parasedimentitalea marina TaxID=2483033 RepID=UPI0013E2BC76|nr:chorismate-binding protein [Parasedimentitalea marina]